MNNHSYVELHVPSFDTAKDFYGKLGFKAAREQKSDDPRKNYLVMALGNNILCFWPGNDQVYTQSYFKNFPAGTKRGYGVETVIQVDNLEEAYKAAQNLGCVVGELTTKHWGKKDFRIEDPFGYYLRFTEPYNILDPTLGV